MQNQLKTKQQKKKTMVMEFKECTAQDSSFAKYQSSSAGLFSITLLNYINKFYYHRFLFLFWVSFAFQELG